VKRFVWILSVLRMTMLVWRKRLTKERMWSKAARPEGFEPGLKWETLSSWMSSTDCEAGLSEIPGQAHRLWSEEEGTFVRQDVRDPLVVSLSILGDVARWRGHSVSDPTRYALLHALVFHSTLAIGRNGLANDSLPVSAMARLCFGDVQTRV